MAEKPKEGPPKGDGFKSAVVLAVVLMAFASFIIANPAVENFLSSAFSRKAPVYQDIVVVSPSDNVFNNAKFYYDKKPKINDIAESGADSKTFFAATDYGIFISYDSGLDWYHIDFPATIGAATPGAADFLQPARRL